jgi:hypothetical protein
MLYSKSLFFLSGCWNVSILVNSLEMLQSITNCPSKELLAWSQAAIFTVTLIIAKASLCLFNISKKSRVVSFNKLFIVNIHKNRSIRKILFVIVSCFVDKAWNDFIGFGLSLNSLVVQFFCLFWKLCHWFNFIKLI